MQSCLRDWGDVRIFLAVVREGSTLAASKALGVAQTTVARRIGGLEQSLGFTLFEKTTRGAKPTPAAYALLADAEMLERSALNLQKTAAKQLALQSKVIRITAINDAFNERFTSILNAFTDQYPDVRFELRPSDDELDISAGDADIAVRIANENTQHDPNLICRRLFELSMSLFASRKYVEKYGRLESLADIDAHRFVTFVDRLLRHPANEWLLERVPNENVVASCGEMLAMSTHVKLGLGIGLLPTRYQLSNPELVHCHELPKGTGAVIWLLVNPVSYERSEVKAFTKFFAPRYIDYYRNL